MNYVIESLPLLERRYQFTAAVYDYSGLHPYDHREREYTFFVRQGEVREQYGALYVPCQWKHRVK